MIVFTSRFEALAELLWRNRQLAKQVGINAGHFLYDIVVYKINKMYTIMNIMYRAISNVKKIKLK